MKEVLWRLKFVQLMKPHQRSVPLRELWDWSLHWIERADTPENAVRMFFGRQALKGGSE